LILVHSCYVGAHSSSLDPQVLKIVKKHDKRFVKAQLTLTLTLTHDKRFVKAQLARTMVPTMLSMAFLQMKGLQKIWSALVSAQKYGVLPLKAMSDRVDEMLGVDGGEVCVRHEAVETRTLTLTLTRIGGLR